MKLENKDPKSDSYHFTKDFQKLKELLDEKVEVYNQPDFIESDPICIPHSFSKKQDIEIMGFWAATLAWGNRKTIIKKCQELITLMDNTPYDFILNHQESDLKSFLDFKHRTFNATDTLYFIHFFQDYYQHNDSLENIFSEKTQGEETIEKGIIHFHDTFFSLTDYPERTKKHVATPKRNSACKRINMFLRWMVRKDNKGVDFGIWQKINPSQLVCPCDVHVERVARKLGMLTSKQLNWKTALELTKNLRLMSAEDPVKYDFALFALGAIEKW